jgi:putative DNA primase/helicase
MRAILNDAHVRQLTKHWARRLVDKPIRDGFNPEALHEYTHQDGSSLYWRIRLKHPYTGDKLIRPMRREGSSFILKEPSFKHGKPLYRLHELATRLDEEVMVVEGETCVDVLETIGVLATTSGSAGSTEKSDWKILSGRVVRLWADNDEAGLKYMKEVEVKLNRLGCEVKIIDVDALDLSPKEDCVDWLKTLGRKATTADIWGLPTIESKVDASEWPRNDLRNESNAITSATSPEPLPELPGVLAFDYGYLPDGLRGYVKDISERMQCPPDFAAVGVMVMMATIVGRKVGIRPMKQNDWTVIPNLWGAVVGNSGVMKSPTLAASMAPIKKLQNAAFDAFNEEQLEYNAQSELIKLQRDINKTEARKALKGNKSADVKGLLQSSETDDAPILRRYITNNASYEALGELLMENDNGLLVESDEIIGLLKQLDAGGQETARSFYLTAADGDKPYTFDRIMRGKGLHIEALCLSIIGGIQPGVLAEYVRQATGGGAGADGLLQRFGLMVYPDISPDWKEVDRFPDSTLRESVNLLAERLDSLNPSDIGAEVDPYGDVPFLRFDDAAQILFSDWRASLEIRLRSGEEHPAIVSHLSKYRKLIPSLALINHLCDSRHGAVSEEALLRAIAFSEYLESHALRIYSYATRPDVDAAKTLLKRLVAGKLPNIFKMRDIYKKGWAGLESPNKAQSAISLLLEYNHLKADEINTGGRPTTQYHWIKEVAV